MRTMIVSRDEWLLARKELLEKEKALTRTLEDLARERRRMPRVRVEKEYTFVGPEGRESLADLFAGRSQLIVYHFMFGPRWDEGCVGCSFWADNFNGTIDHIEQRDATMVAISRAPLAKLEAFKERMGWSFKWVSSGETDFNFDFGVSFPRTGEPGERTYNYEVLPTARGEGHGVSVFYKDANGEVFHTYSCYARGVEILNAAYQYIDLLPKGRDEDALPAPHAWIRHHDRYPS